MGEDTNRTLFKKLDELKDDIHEIKQMFAIMQERDMQRDLKIEYLEERILIVEGKVINLEKKAYFLRGYWKAIVLVSTVLAFALNYVKDLFVK